MKGVISWRCDDCQREQCIWPDCDGWRFAVKSNDDKKKLRRFPKEGAEVGILGPVEIWAL